MTTKQHFDYLVIGGGSAGYAAARTARRFVERVAIVDAAEELGGLCILRGCMPSKTLIYSAEVLHLAKQAAKFGLDIPHAGVDMPALHARKKRLIAEFSEYRQSQLQSDRFTLFRSHARFNGDNSVVLDDGTTLSADHFLIATGSKVAVPDIPGLAGCGCWTSDEVLDMRELPPSAIVLGGGVVACELAQFLHRAGCQTTLIQRSPHILREYSTAAAEVLENVMRGEGMEIITDTALCSVEALDQGFRVAYRHQGATHTREAPRLINALGRKPATDALALDQAGVEITRSGHIRCDDFLQSSNPLVYAAGDAAGPHEIVHIAIMQGETAALHALGQPARPINYDTRLSVVFTDPQIALAGLSEAEIQRRGIDYVSAMYPFDDHGKSILMEARAGYVKVFAAKSDGRVLGAECVGKDASELIHALSVSLALRATVADLLAAHWYHPTLAEIWTYPLEDCADAIL